LLQEHHHVEDEHHNWLGGTTALKFLAAGGVAGAGQRLFCTHPLQHVSLSAHWTMNSVAVIHSSV
jgi:solute carrier family 25 phosphate transporter 23/24/25/41